MFCLFFKSKAICKTCNFPFCETESVKVEMQGICEKADLTIIYMQKKTENFYFFDNRAHWFWFEKNVQVVLIY